MAGFLQDSSVYWGEGVAFGSQESPPPGSKLCNNCDPGDPFVFDETGDGFISRSYAIGKALVSNDLDQTLNSSKEVVSLQTVVASQLFTLEETLGNSATFTIEEIAYTSGPSIGGAFSIVSTLFQRVLSPNELTEEITVELPSEMHIRLSVSESDSRIFLRTAEGSEPAFWTNFIKATERPL